MSDVALIFDIQTGPALNALTELSNRVSGLVGNLQKVMAAAGGSSMDALAREMRSGGGKVVAEGEKVGGEAGRKFSSSFRVALADGTSATFKSVGSELTQLVNRVSAAGKQMHEELRASGIQTAAEVKAAARAATADREFTLAASKRIERELAMERSASEKRLAEASRVIRARQKAESDYVSWWQSEMAKVDKAMTFPVQLHGQLATAMTRLSSGAKEAAKSKTELASATEKATKNTAHWTSAARDAHSAARGLAGSIGMLWTTWGNTIPIIAGAAIGASIRETVRVGKELEYQLTFVKELTGGAAISFNDFGNAVRGSMFSLKEAAEGLRALAQNGLSAEEALRALPTVLRLATVGEMSVAEAAYGATGIMHAFNLEVSDLGRVADVFAKAAAISNTSVSGMVGAMKQASVVGDMYGVTMEETAASLAVMAKRNIEGTAAGTAFRNMIKEITAPTEKAAKLIEAMGLEFYTAGKQLKPFPELLRELAVTTATLNEKGKITFLNEMFGERGAKAINTLLSDYKMFGDYLDELTDKHASFTSRVVQSLEDTLQGKIKRMIVELQLSFAEAFKGSEASIKETVDALRRMFESQDFKSMVKSITIAVAELTTFFAEHAKVIGTVVAAYAGFSVLRYATERLIGFGSAIGMASGSAKQLGESLRWVERAETTTMAAARAGTVLAGEWSSLVAIFRSSLAVLTPWLAILGGVGGAIAIVVSKLSEHNKMLHDADEYAKSYTATSTSMVEAYRRETDELVKKNAELAKSVELMRSGGDARLAGKAVVVATAQSEYNLVNAQVRYLTQFKEAAEAARVAGKSFFELNGEITAVSDWGPEQEQKLISFTRELQNAATNVVTAKNEFDRAGRELKTGDYLSAQRELIESVRKFNAEMELGAKKKPQLASFVISKEQLDAWLKDAQAGLEAFKAIKERINREVLSDAPKGSAKTNSPLALMNQELKTFATEYRAAIAEVENALASGDISFVDAYFKKLDVAAKKYEEVVTDIQKTRKELKGKSGSEETIKVLDQKLQQALNEYLATASGFGTEFEKALAAAEKEAQGAFLKYSKGVITEVDRFAEEFKSKDKLIASIKSAIENSSQWNLSDEDLGRLKELVKQLEKIKELGSAQAKWKDEVRSITDELSSLEAQVAELQLQGDKTFLDGLLADQQSVALVSAAVDELRARVAKLREEGSKASLAEANTLTKRIVTLEKSTTKHWEKFADQIEQSLTDALMRGFENGNSFGENFVKTLQNTLKTAALKLAVQVIVSPIMGAVRGAMKLEGGGLGGMSNIFSPISNIATSSIGGSAFGAGMLSGVSESMLGASFVGPSASLAGNASIAGGAAFGSFLPAIGLALGALALFGGDLFGGKEKPPEINIANVPKGTKWAVSAGAGPFGELQMAGKHLGETEQEVQKMVDGLLKPIIAADTALSAYLTKGEVGSISSALSGWSSGEVEFESEQQIHDLVNARLAVISDTIGGWVDALADTVTGTSEEVYNALGQILSVRGVEGAEAIARELLDGAEGAFAETGESVAQTLVRLVSSLDAFNTAAESLGWTTQEMTAAWGEAASELMTAFGGREGFATAIAGYYERYYSDAEKLANVTRLVQEQFDKLGLTMPDTKDQFRALVESFDPMTEAGREAVVGLLKVEEAFTKVAAGAVDAAREVAADRRDFVAARRAQQDAERLAAVPAFSGTAGEYNYLTAMEQVRAGNFGVTRSGEFAGYVRNELSSGMSKALSDSLHDALDFATTQTIEQRYASPLDRAASAYSMALSGRDIDAYKDAMADIGRAFATGAIGADDYARGLAAIADWFADTIPVVDDLAAQMQRVEGAAYMLGRTGLETIASEFGAIGEEAKRLAAAAAEAQEPIAQATDAIARLSGTSAQLGRGSAAAYYGFSEGGVEGRMMLDASMGTIRTASVISLAAGIASSILTTADAAKAAAQLSDQFTNKRDASLLLDGLREYDTASFEKAFTRINDAFIKGRLDEDQYAELFDIAVKTFEGPNTEAERLAQNFYDLSQAAGSLADALRVGKDTTYMNPAQRFAEATRQYLEDLAGARGGSMESMRELERSSRVYLGAAQDNAHDITEYRLASARAIAAIGGIARQGATIDDLIAEQQATREELKSLRAALEAGQALGVKQARRTADTLEKWDVTGMPA